MCDGNDCCRTLAKVILIIVNLFFFLLGLLMLAFGIALVVAPDKVVKSVLYGVDLSILDGSNYVIIGFGTFVIGIFMIVLGAIVAFIGALWFFGAFGFFGACCENRVLLILYLIIVILILLAEIALIICAALISNASVNLVKTAVRNTLIKRYSQDLQTNASDAVYIKTTYEFGYSWAATQIGAKCCGIDSPADYQNITDKTIEFRGRNISVAYPLSCCKLNDGVKFPPNSAKDFVNIEGCSKGEPGSYNTVGCFPANEANKVTIPQVAKIAIGIAAAIVGLEILIIIFGFILCCALDRSKAMAV